MELEYTYFSEIGTRENNEDCLRVVTLPEYDRTLFIVCDGMGGHSYGEIASEAVCKSISAYWEKNPKQNDSEQKVYDATIQAYSMLKNQSLGYEMGTTMVLASLENDRAMVTHSGDSRCYIVDIKGHVKYRTIDHVDDVGYITNCFFTGRNDLVKPDIRFVQLEPYDRILLCTDGLYNTIDDEMLLHTLHCARDVSQVEEKYKIICQDKASDNYTAVIIEIGTNDQPVRQQVACQ